LYPTMIFGICAALIGFANLEETVALLVVLGVMDSFTFTSMYASPFQMEELSFEQKAISISLMNSIQIIGAFVMPIAFTSIAASSSYTLAWVVTGLFCLAFVPLLLFVREPFKNKLNVKQAPGSFAPFRSDDPLQN
jgi:MFS family permease